MKRICTECVSRRKGKNPATTNKYHPVLCRHKRNIKEKGTKRKAQT
jgi:hypothetical protein